MKKHGLAPEELLSDGWWEHIPNPPYAPRDKILACCWNALQSKDEILRMHPETRSWPAIGLSCRAHRQDPGRPVPLFATPKNGPTADLQKHRSEGATPHHALRWRLRFIFEA